MAHEKVGKQATLYLHKPNTEYECRDCAMFIARSKRCSIHGPNDVIMPYGSCGLFVKGKPMPGMKPMSEVTKEESGYIDSIGKKGYSCKRCVYFDADNLNCAIVDRFSAGPDYGFIDPDGCCNAWEELEVEYE